MAEQKKGSGDDVERGRLALPCDPSPMAFDKYRSHVPAGPARPDLARPPVRPRRPAGPASTCATATRP